MSERGLHGSRIFCLVTLGAAAMLLLGATGCEKKPAKGTGAGTGTGTGAHATSTGTGGTATGGDVLVLEYEEIDIIPGGEEKHVKVKSGKAEKAEAPADSGVTAKVDDGNVTVSASKEAKAGTHEVTVKGGKKDTTLKVHVKKAPDKDGK
jgi:hypothetical protein